MAVLSAPLSAALPTLALAARADIQVVPTHRMAGSTETCAGLRYPLSAPFSRVPLAPAHAAVPASACSNIQILIVKLVAASTVRVHPATYWPTSPARPLPFVLPLFRSGTGDADSLTAFNAEVVSGHGVPLWAFFRENTMSSPRVLFAGDGLQVGRVDAPPMEAPWPVEAARVIAVTGVVQRQAIRNWASPVAVRNPMRKRLAVTGPARPTPVPVSGDVPRPRPARIRLAARRLQMLDDTAPRPRPANQVGLDLVRVATHPEIVPRCLRYLDCDCPWPWCTKRKPVQRDSRGNYRRRRPCRVCGGGDWRRIGARMIGAGH